MPKSVLRNRMIQKNYLQRRQVRPRCYPASCPVNGGTQSCMPELVLSDRLFYKNYLQRCKMRLNALNPIELPCSAVNGVLQKMQFAA